MNVWQAEENHIAIRRILCYNFPKQAVRKPETIGKGEY